MSASKSEYGLSFGFRLLQELQLHMRYVFSAAVAQEVAAQLGASNVNDLLHRLARAGHVRRLRRGYYAIAATTPSVPKIPEFHIATRILEPSAISHWSAMGHHGLTDQIPRRITAFTPKKFITPAMRKSGHTESSDLSKSGQFWEIDHIRYEYLYVLPRSFFGIEEIWLGELFKVPITDKERTLLEGFINPTYFWVFRRRRTTFRREAERAFQCEAERPRSEATLASGL
jgi:predicted transcriptional regulator of viral defense system